MRPGFGRKAKNFGGRSCLTSGGETPTIGRVKRSHLSGCFAAVLFAIVTANASPTLTEANYIAKIEAAREQRVERLTRPDGWLSLIGLHFLTAGQNRVGTAPDNTIVLAAGPAHLGTVMLGEDGAATMMLNPAAGATVGGAQVLSTRLDERGPYGPTVVNCGSVSAFLIERGGRKALRVKDSASLRRTQFAGIDYFPIDPSWRVEAQWVPFERPRQVMIQNILGQESPASVPGKAVFVRDGQTFELLPLIESPDEPLFFVIADLTSGEETYAAARFVYASPSADGKLVIDFNEAVNPPCAFTPFATCPLPPKENRLAIAVRAGEKKYRGAHE